MSSNKFGYVDYKGVFKEVGAQTEAKKQATRDGCIMVAYKEGAQVIKTAKRIRGRWHKL